MRIITGSHKGREIEIPKTEIEPTKGFVKEALFNIIGDQLVGKSFLDLCAGSGNVGIEALSRGAEHVIFVDMNEKCIQTIKRNLSILKLNGQVLKQDMFHFLKDTAENRFDYFFADPPYHDNVHKDLLLSIVHSHLLKPDSIIILEHLSKTKLIKIPQQLSCTDQRIYGITSLSFFKVK